MAISGEPSSVQILAYASADFAGRVGRIAPRTSAARASQGKSSTRGSIKNSSR
jgi:hypothetical protein